MCIDNTRAVLRNLYKMAAEDVSGKVCCTPVFAALSIACVTGAIYTLVYQQSFTVDPVYIGLDLADN